MKYGRASQLPLSPSPGIRDWWDNEGGNFAFQSGVREVIDNKLRNENEPVRPFNEMWTIFQAHVWQ